MASTLMYPEVETGEQRLQRTHAALAAAGLPLPTDLVVHGYVTVDGKKIGKSRAIDLLDGQIHGDPRGYAFFPWGAHALVAGELWLVGRSNAMGIAIVQSIASAFPAVCVVFFTARVV